MNWLKRNAEAVEAAAAVASLISQTRQDCASIAPCN